MSEQDERIEQEIKDKGLIYPRVEKEAIDQLMAKVEYDVHVIPSTTTTVVAAILPLEHIKFSLCTEIMACVDPRNYNAELGRKYGIEKAKASARNKLWELEGYALAKMLATPEVASSERIKQIAKLAHEINAAYCLSQGDDSQPSWEEAPDWQKGSAINGVIYHLQNPNAKPSDSHESWLEEKRQNGWKYGKVKNPETKEHPCFVPYEQLPPGQKAKDYLFKQVVDSMRSNLGQTL